MNRQPPFWTVIVRCLWCKGTTPAQVPRGQREANRLCRDCDARIGRWLAHEDGQRGGSLNGFILASKAREYVGTPFHHGGSNEHGMDCAGLLVRCLHDLGWTDWKPASYGRQVQPNALYGALRRFCDRIDTAHPLTLYNTEGAALMEAGDLLLFAIGGHPQHLAIANGTGGMIHAHEAAKRVVEQPIDAGWLRRLVSVWRWRGSE